MSAYLDFLASKVPAAQMRGIESGSIASYLFPFQRACVDFTLRCGSAGLFLDTGLGKTACELEWSEHARQATNGHALILTPLAVAQQIAAEGRRFGYEARVIREQSEAREGINVCNYDRLERIDPQAFGSVALDESSILNLRVNPDRRESRMENPYAPPATPAPICSDFHAPAAREPYPCGPASDAAFSERVWNEACERLSSPPALN